jgi:hypothetical protein
LAGIQTGVNQLTVGAVTYDEAGQHVTDIAQSGACQSGLRKFKLNHDQSTGSHYA